MVMCNVYKLLRDGKRHTKTGMVLQREKILVSREYANAKNYQWELGGLWYEFLEEETKVAFELGRKQAMERKKAEKVANKLRDTLTDVVERGLNVSEPIEEIEVVEENVVEPVKEVVKKTTTRRKKRKYTKKSK